MFRQLDTDAMTDAILVVNAGSSSIKFAGYAEGGSGHPRLLARGQVEGLRTAPRFVFTAAPEQAPVETRWSEPITHGAALSHIMGAIATHLPEVRLVAAGHRVVFGGSAHTGPTVVGADVIAELDRLVPFFPLHLNHNLAAIRALGEQFPAMPQVACFDNTFHHSLPRVAQWFALPRALVERGVRRYGFHGLSYEYIAARLPEALPAARRVVVAHLGSGASMCALKDGRSIECTLGFSGLDGLPMGTRPGPLDPGVLLYLMQAQRMDAQAIERLLYNESGLLGVSGISNDMRDLADSDDPRAREAVELFVYHIAKQLGALAAVLEGLDAIVFTAGIGEKSAAVRKAVCARAAWLGVAIDDDANSRHGPQISVPGSAVSVWVIPTDEERMIAVHTARLLAKST
jgi:acetate kinase